MFDDESAPAVEPIAQGRPVRIGSRPWRQRKPRSLPRSRQKRCRIGSIRSAPATSPFLLLNEQTDWVSGLGEPAASLPSEDQPGLVEEPRGRSAFPSPSRR
ncbi:MAG: hypothetical protein MZV70_17795 [Desulfobacterales bacterium]|nr:hypothetical protein [Desulfobacterales bacterium]